MCALWKWMKNEIHHRQIKTNWLSHKQGEQNIGN